MDISRIRSLPINLQSFGFVTREWSGTKILKNRCGRDFFYYALNYYYPQKYNPKKLNPVEIEKSGAFGIKLPVWLIWTGLSFYKIPRLFQTLDLTLEINNRKIGTFVDFIKALLPTKPKLFNQGLAMIKNSVDEQKVCGIDISVSLGGLVDHVMFVYGYDENNLYVFDTNQVTKIKYEKITETLDNRFIMRLPFDEIEKRWSRFNRVWIISKK